MLLQVDVRRTAEVAAIFQAAVTAGTDGSATQPMRRALSAQARHVGTALAAELRFSCNWLAGPVGSATSLARLSAAVAQLLAADAVPHLQHVGDVAAHSMVAHPDLWALPDVAKLVAACATAGACSHRLFSVAPHVIAARMHPNVLADAERDGGEAALGEIVVSAETALWAFSVMRRTYPYSAKAVSNAACVALEHALLRAPEHVPPDALAEMLWTLAAMSHRPTRLFLSAANRLAQCAGTLDAKARESIRWSLMRARVDVPLQLQD
jgi:hypothetical protein